MLALSIGLLVLVTVVAVLGVGLWTSYINTFNLLRDKASLTIDSAVAQIEQHLTPAEEQAKFVSDLIAEGALDPVDRSRMGDVLTGALAAASHIKLVVFIDTEFQLIGVARVDDRPNVYTADYRGDPAVEEAVTDARGAEGPHWGEPVWREKVGETILNLRQPVRRGGEYLGILLAAVTVSELSEYLSQLNRTIGNNAFILYERDHILAHPYLTSHYPGLSTEAPLPAVASFGDPILQAIWQEEGRFPLEVTEGSDFQGHALQIYGDEYVFIYRDELGFGSRPWQIGTYFQAASVDEELRRLMHAGIAGLVALVLACLAAVVLARSLAKPIIRASTAASRISELEISRVTELPRTIFRELNQQADSFNAMLGGLRWFETYVPKSLVQRLIREGDPGSLASDKRNVTVMFTDIAGFTRLSENLAPSDVAEFLNAHFAMIAAEVEREGGTVDKFMGDAVMAYWGAPEKQKNRAERACRAALAIATALHADNAQRRQAGKEPIRVRIGIHSGSVTVGNIGAPGRINYTILGDTVNIAQRLEQLCKELYPPDSEISILASGATVSDLGPEFESKPAGRHSLRGRDESIDVFKLI